LGEEENDYVISQPNLVHTVSKHAFVWGGAIIPHQKNLKTFLIIYYEKNWT
jgi:hypothetical protein